MILSYEHDEGILNFTACLVTFFFFLLCVDILNLEKFLIPESVVQPRAGECCQPGSGRSPDAFSPRVPADGTGLCGCQSEGGRYSQNIDLCILHSDPR